MSAPTSEMTTQPPLPLESPPPLVTPDASNSTDPEHDDDEEAQIMTTNNNEDDSPRTNDDETRIVGSDQPPLPDEPAPPVASTTSAAAATAVHKGRDPNWSAVWDPTRGAYYFYNAATGVTQWTNPFEESSVTSTVVASTSNDPTASTSTLPKSTSTNEEEKDNIDYGGIDPDLAFLDPNLARKGTSAAPTFQARFNSKTGRFQGDPAMNPDRISDYSRGTRQQQAFYDTTAWTESLQGKGLRPAAVEEEDEQSGKKKRPTSKQVEQFKQKKEQRKRAKLMSFLS